MTKGKMISVPFRTVRANDEMLECIASMLEGNLRMVQVYDRNELANGTFMLKTVACAVQVTCTLKDRPRIREFLDQWFTHDSYHTVQLPEADRIRRERERKAMIRNDIAALTDEVNRLKKMLKTA